MMKVPILSERSLEDKKPEYLFWVGCAGAFDERYKQVTIAFAKILNHIGTNYVCLGKEETCTGDPAKRAGNEMLFQMQALTNIETFNKYDIKKIITICPHCFNTFANEYSELGGKYEVINYTQFIDEKIKDGSLKVTKNILLNDQLVTYHDPCYLGRGNGIYDSPRNVINEVSPNFVEIKRNKSFSLCCGGGGAQMFKESETGNKEINQERTQDIIETEADIVLTACPFCMIMLQDGIKKAKKEKEIINKDIAELIAETLQL